MRLLILLLLLSLTGCASTKEVFYITKPQCFNESSQQRVDFILKCLENETGSVCQKIAEETICKKTTFRIESVDPFK